MALPPAGAPRRGGAVVLRRPAARNAADLAVVQEIREAVNRTEGPLVVESAVPGVFCAGGDVKDLRARILDSRGNVGEGSHARAVFETEYGLVCDLAQGEACTVCCVDGICMGFGLGLALWSDFCVATERSVFAMPENRIGLFPDVGFAPYVWARCQRPHLGLFVALTGCRLTAADLILGLGAPNMTCVPESRLEALRTGIRAADCALLQEIIEEASKQPKERSVLLDNSDAIEECLQVCMEPGANPALAVAAFLEQARERGGFVAEATEDCRSGRASPSSMVATQIHFSRVRKELDTSGSLDLPKMMLWERDLALHLVAQPDFSEGVRALLVDKDGEPSWAPSSILEAGGILESMENRCIG